MDMAMVNLQAAVMAAAAGGTGAVTADSTEGASFSDVLAAQSGAVAKAQGTADTVAADAGTEVVEEVKGGAFEEIVYMIDHADEGLKKAMKLLLETVLNAFKTSDDGEERKTDIFMLFSDTSDIESEYGINRDLLLTGAEILGQAGTEAEKLLAEMNSGDDIIAELSKLAEKLFDTEKNGENDDTDENTAADMLAAMLNIPVADIPYATEEAKTEAVESAAEILTAPKQAVAEYEPEAVKEMEQLYSELKAVVKTDSKPEAETSFKVRFTALKINDASEQIRSARPLFGTEEKAAADELPAEITATGIEFAQADTAGTEVIRQESDVIDTDTAFSVREQVTEKITETFFDIEGESGTKELVMVLKPENLGQIAVKLVKENGAVSVMLSAQYEDVGRLINERADILGSSLESQNVTVKSVEVVNPGTAAAEMGLDFTNQGFGRQGYSDSGNGSSYRGQDGIDGIEETDSVSGEEKLKEAKLWTIA
ncbi:MAG: flagellar hook-length control protein FliK [Oscillospiraceae bacterium]|nr:flagellar hook-length control protein FliK [Oscillospiraceae bacterium]